ncbi:MAG TPA: type III-A CRISPR-associated RAMP protein Csm3 [Mariniphaga anaerophila]|uniref:CRISPR system Cms endoribonuclease Csm3 n=1 Tax=Mariniphaga anaerophila TaxID=1484053 RepID=A0A831LJE6_9BACT|nr:type III-A CRISPR-associated RAMP protein Csm3 [Mariniphaga anaerophila]
MAKLTKKYIITGKIECLTGLHIGGTNSAMGIGGPDSMVIRNPLNNKPIIPGSSLKGKMRSLLELSLGELGGSIGSKIKNGPTQNKNHLAVKLFGSADSRGDNQLPSRIIVRDASLLTPDEKFSNTDMPYTETKTEVVIDRITSGAMPRQIERVPAGAEFSLNMVLNIFDSDNNEDELIAALKSSMRLLEDDYLGGNGSRGYGQIAFSEVVWTEKKLEDYLTN